MLKALATLEDIVSRKEVFAEPDCYNDTLIQRFEYTYDLLWKYAQYVLREHYGVALASPKPIFRELLKNGILDQKECEQCIQMADDRNNTSHAYKEDLALTIGQRIPEHAVLIKKIALQLAAAKKQAQ